MAVMEEVAPITATEVLPKWSQRKMAEIDCVATLEVDPANVVGFVRRFLKCVS